MRKRLVRENEGEGEIIQRRGEMKKFLILFFILGMILAWSAPLRAETKPSVAILPFLIEKVDDPTRGAVCPVCKGVYRKGDILPGSQNTLTRLLQEKIEAMDIFKILPPEKVEEALSQSERRQFELKPVALVHPVGKDIERGFYFYWICLPF